MLCLHITKKVLLIAAFSCSDVSNKIYESNTEFNTKL